MVNFSVLLNGRGLAGGGGPGEARKAHHIVGLKESESLKQLEPFGNLNMHIFL